MKFRKKPVVIEAFTFDEIVEHGKRYCLTQPDGSMVNGVPWSFKFDDHPITHEDDECYLIPTLEGTMKFYKGDMLIVGVKGEIYLCRKDIFDQTYESV